MWKSLLCAVAAASAQHPLNVAAQPSARELIPVGLEFCVIAAEDPDRAAEFAWARGLVDTALAEETMHFSLDENAPALMSARVHRDESGGFAVECGFEVGAVGEVTREQVDTLASQFALQVMPGEEGRYLLTRQSPNLAVFAYAGPSNAIICPVEGLEIAPDVLRDHPDIVEELAEVCDKPGFRVTVQSVYSRTGLTP